MTVAIQTNTIGYKSVKEIDTDELYHVHGVPLIR